MLFLALLLAAAPAIAQEEPGVRFYALTAAEVALTGDTDPAVRPSAEIEVDGPLALGTGAPLRVYARFRTFGLPGETVDLGDVKTFRAAELSLGGYRRVGRLVLGDQEVWTSIEGEWGFATALPAAGAPAALRYPRHYGVGIRLEERRGGAWLSVLYGRHESAGDRLWGQWLVGGAVPLTVSKGVLVLGGDAMLTVGPRGGPRQRDLLRIYVAVSVPDLIGVFAR